MTREQYSRILMDMERTREASYEAETKAEERRLIAQYNRMWKAIKPFAEGKKPLEGEGLI